MHLTNLLTNLIYINSIIRAHHLYNLNKFLNKKNYLKISIKFKILIILNLRVDSKINFLVKIIQKIIHIQIYLQKINPIIIKIKMLNK